MPDKRLEIVLAGKDLTGKAFKNVQGRVGRLRKSFAGLTSATGYLKAAFAGLAAAGIGHIIKSSLDAADAIGKTADVIGITTDALQEYRHVANLSGVDTGLMEGSLSAFAKRVGEARQKTGALTTFLKKFDEQLLDNIKNSKSTDDALKLVFDRMGRTATATDRAALASAAFSRAGVKMVNFVKDGADGLARMRQEARDLGLVMNQDLIRASEKANDELEKLGKLLKIELTTAIVQFAPEIKNLAEGMINAFKAIKDFRSGMRDIEMRIAKTLGIELLPSEWVDQTKEMVDRYEHETRRLEMLTGQWKGAIEKNYVQVIKDANQEISGLDIVAIDLGEMFKLYDTEMSKRLAKSQENWDKLLGADTGIDFVAGDIGAMFDFYDEKMQKRLDKSRENWQQLLTPDGIDFVASDLGSMFDFYEEEMAKRLQESQDRWAEHNSALVDLVQNTAERMQSTFSDVFFDAMTGKLDSFKDYTNAIFESISRSMADLLSKQLAEGLFNAGGDDSDAGGGIGGLFSTIFANLFHKGGIVGEDRPAMRQVPAAAFVGAPRLHDGLMPGEFPAILQKGEAVIPKKQVAKERRGAFNPTININISAPTGNLPRQSISQLQAGIVSALDRANRRNN